MTIFVALLSSVFFSTVFGVVLAYLGNFIVQHALHRRSIRIDAFRNMLSEYAMIVSKYWIGSHESSSDKARLEAEIKVRQLILIAEFRSLSRKYKAVRKIREKYLDKIRSDLMVAATGGPFESKDWQPDPQRAQAVTQTVTQVLSDLP